MHHRSGAEPLRSRGGNAYGASMQISSPRLRRLDGALANLPAESDAMLLSELDGFLAGVVTCPEPIAPAEWLPVVWGTPDAPLFEDENEERWYADLVTGHHDAIVAAFAKEPSRYKPFLEVDTRNREVLWELWIEGFAAAVDLRPDAWDGLMDDASEDVSRAFSGLTTLIEIATDASDLERDVIDRLTEDAPDLIPGWIEVLARRRTNSDAAPLPVVVPPTSLKVGRNDPCSCGSGRKNKKCCGAG